MRSASGGSSKYHGYASFGPGFSHCLSAKSTAISAARLSPEARNTSAGSAPNTLKSTWRMGVTAKRASP